MPELVHEKQMRARVQEVWDFVKDQNNWAPFLMGYQNHQILNDKESIWKLKSSIAGVTYSFKMEVLITEWEEGKKMGFELRGLTHPVKGSGTVTLKEAGSRLTDVSFHLHLQGRGITTPVMNLVVGPLLKPMAEQLLDKINEVMEQTSVRA
ncbi:SRPBCC family protein [Marivirga salinae]|uniref:SRPBCC family protein n=1 Tax=Marivirga salinarum TaxID=3059078 RepID=A0AA51RCS4_9BACT|nr:SRPBCC family protein [Marivirga sp. BDSF4-3]WMN12123.1 SRPBCC family protein [Marivirga sp. BDSF4-3]